jgi:hypothetical protein
MKYFGYSLAATAGFCAGLWYRSRSRRWHNLNLVYVQLRKSGGTWMKTVDPDPVDVCINARILWIIEWDKADGQPDLEILNFRTQGGQKNPLTMHPHGRMEEGIAVLRGRVRGRDMLLEHPPATDHDPSHGLSQQFTYSLKIDQDTVDPDIRVREF